MKCKNNINICKIKFVCNECLKSYESAGKHISESFVYKPNYEHNTGKKIIMKHSFT